MTAGSLVRPAPAAPARRGPASFWTLAALAVAALVALPVVAVLASLARPRGDVWAHLWRTQLPELIGNTLVLLAAVGAGTLALGTALAWLVVAHRFPGRGLFEWALMLPLAVPAYVIGFVFLGLFDYAGPLQTLLRQALGPGARPPAVPAWAGVASVMTLVFYPYVYLLARAAFREQGAAALETARSLGRSRRQTFVEVVLPMARPSLVAGASLAMMEALADFGTVAVFSYRTLTEGVYRVWLGLFDPGAATQLAALLLLLALALLSVERALRGRARFVQSQRRGPGLTPVRLRGWRAAAATALCAGVLGLAFVLPVGQLGLWAWSVLPGPVPEFRARLGHTLALATAAAFTTGGLALILGYACRRQPTGAVRGLAQLAATGYALPGAVIAVGVLTSLAAADHALAAVIERLAGRPVGLLLTGSAVGLVFAYVVRFLAVGFQTVDAGLARIPPSLDDAARSLGAGPLRTVGRVHLPLMRAGVLTALLLVFVETMKEMPATLLLRPLGLDTLAVSVFERTAESLWAEAAVPALAIVGAGLVPVLLAVRLSGAGPTR